MEAKCYNLLRNLIVPGKPSDKKFSELVEILGKHLKPQPVVIAERFKFYKWIQRKDESVADLMAALRKLSEHCQFGDFLDQALRDMLVCGLKNTAAQKRPLAEAKLEWNKALEIALSIGMAEKTGLGNENRCPEYGSRGEAVESRSRSHWSAACRSNNW